MARPALCGVLWAAAVLLIITCTSPAVIASGESDSGKRVTLSVRAIEPSPAIRDALLSARARTETARVMESTGTAGLDRAEAELTANVARRKRLAAQTYFAAAEDSDAATAGIDGWSLYSSSVISLANRLNVAYTGSIGIGTPKPKPAAGGGFIYPAQQRFEVVFDTGSADLWLFSAQTQQPKRSYLRYYDSSLSSTYVADNTPFEITYGHGKCLGKLSTDVLTLGGPSLVPASNSSAPPAPDTTPPDQIVPGNPGAPSGDSLIIGSINPETNDPYPLQVFAETTQFTANFDDQTQPIDGVLGLAYASVAQSKAKTVFDNLFSQGQISRKAVSFELSRNAGEDGSKMILGEPDVTYAPKGFTYLDAFQESGLWVVKLDDLLLDDVTIANMCGTDSTCVALIDTGTSLIGIPYRRWTAVVAAITAQRPDCKVNSDNNVVCTTLTRDRLPNLSFKLKGRDFILTPADYMIGNVVAIMQQAPTQQTYDFFILGVTFIKRYYTVFDMGTNQIGFANPTDTVTLTWWLIVTVVAAVMLLMSSAFGCVWLKHRRQAKRRALRAAASAGNSSVDSGLANGAGGSAGAAKHHLVAPGSSGGAGGSADAARGSAGEGDPNERPTGGSVGDGDGDDRMAEISRSNVGPSVVAGSVISAANANNSAGDVAISVAGGGAAGGGSAGSGHNQHHSAGSAGSNGATGVRAIASILASSHSGGAGSTSNSPLQGRSMVSASSATPPQSHAGHHPVLDLRRERPVTADGLLTPPPLPGAGAAEPVMVIQIDSAEPLPVPRANTNAVASAPLSAPLLHHQLIAQQSTGLLAPTTVASDA